MDRRDGETHPPAGRSGCRLADDPSSQEGLLPEAEQEHGAEHRPGQTEQTTEGGGETLSDVVTSLTSDLCSSSTLEPHCFYMQYFFKMNFTIYGLQVRQQEHSLMRPALVLCCFNHAAVEVTGVLLIFFFFLHNLLHWWTLTCIQYLYEIIFYNVELMSVDIHIFVTVMMFKKYKALSELSVSYVVVFFVPVFY